MPSPSIRSSIRGLSLGALIAIVASACATGTSPVSDAADPLHPEARPVLIIAHRGASGHLPEHTLEAYELAVRQGADYIEPDLVITRDGVLVARHENEIGGTTNVAELYPDRRTRRIVDGRTVEGWFAEDLTLAELRAVRARERLATRSHAADDRFAVPTFDEILTLVRRLEGETGRTIGVYPETKHPSYFRAIGLALEEPLLAALDRHGFGAPGDAVYIQSFETANLRWLRARTRLPLVQLFAAGELPPDLAAAGDARTVDDLLTPAGLREIASYADAIGIEKALALTPGVRPRAAPNPLVRDAHAAGLRVHVWTFRSDAPFLAPAYAGDPAAEYRAFAALGVDGVFTDFPDDAVAALRPGGR